MEYLGKIDSYRQEMIETLQELIKIPSVDGKAEEGAPFGKEVGRALDFMLNTGRAWGFEVENIDGYGGHIDFGGYVLDEEGDIVGTSDEILGILVHLDVVPAGNNWDADPFGGELKDGKVFGRGAIDDKGPTIAAFYAMKALKEAGVVPEKKVRMILGLDEETNWIGIKKYFAKAKMPDFAFTPDAEFPVIHGEKGLLVFEIAKKFGKSQDKGGLQLRTLTGGNAPNMVADNARAVLKGNDYDKIREKAITFTKENGYDLKVKGIGKNLEIVAQGISAHGARPEKGLNAISIMMKFLEGLNIENEDIRDFLEFYNRFIGFQLNGEGLGVGFSDEPSGALICNVGLVHMDQEAVRLTLNIRYPVTFSEEQVYESMMPLLNQYNMGLVKKDYKGPIFIPKEDERIKTLMEIYQKHTGDRESQPIVIGGGTYARSVKSGVAFGANFPGEKEVAHQKNEFISVDSLVLAAKIYADAIFQLSGGVFGKRESEEGFIADFESE